METIIVQETDASVLDVLIQALELENFQVYPLQDTEHNFLALIDEIRPHVVILDFKITGVKSLQILRTIKTAYPHLPVIALSCNNNINTVALAHGFDDYIRKPFDFELLYTVLRKHIIQQI